MPTGAIVQPLLWSRYMNSPLWIWAELAVALTINIVFALFLFFFHAWDWSPTLIVFIIWDGYGLWKALRARKSLRTAG
jgi:hypothetical protein